MTDTLPSADIQMIQRIIPHRYPFLLVDKVVDIQGHAKRRRIKNVHDERTAFSGAFSRYANHAWRHHRRSHGADCGL